MTNLTGKAGSDLSVPSIKCDNLMSSFLCAEDKLVCQ